MSARWVLLVVCVVGCSESGGFVSGVDTPFGDVGPGETQNADRNWHEISEVDTETGETEIGDYLSVEVFDTVELTPQPDIGIPDLDEVEICAPYCDGMPCGGDDGCGGSCEGTCSDSFEVCQEDADGEWACECEFLECGGECCPLGALGCLSDSCLCISSCSWLYQDYGIECGDVVDDCGEMISCGDCGPSGHCNEDNSCVCELMKCGPECCDSDQLECVEDQCYPCKPDCQGKACGEPDGCGDWCDGPCEGEFEKCSMWGSCSCAFEHCWGSCCGPDEVCNEEVWECESCLKSCTGKECGEPDGCGGSCFGPCPNEAEVCSDSEYSPWCVCAGPSCAGECCPVDHVCFWGECCKLDSCKEIGVACGEHDLGCGTVQSCGDCGTWGTCVEESWQCDCEYATCDGICCGPWEDCVEVDEVLSCLSCVPDCSGAVCGDEDGCGGTCNGPCPGPNQVCGATNICECLGQWCVDACCPVNHVCSDSQCCELLTCEELGFSCGLHNLGCGEYSSCGTCAENESCSPDSVCKCDFEICGGQCCSEDWWCHANLGCVPPECDPDCPDAECGPDGCGGSCGDCDPGQICIVGSCQAPQCDDGNEIPWDGCTGGLLTESVVNSCWAGNQRRPEVVARPEGGYLVTWMSENEADSTCHGLMGRLFSTDGVPLGEETKILPFGELLTSINYAVDVLPDGRVAIARNGLDTDLGETGGLLTLFSPELAPVTGDISVETVQGQFKNVRTLTAFGDGRIFVTWTSSGEYDCWGLYDCWESSTNGDELRGRLFDTNGVQLTEPAQINTNPWGSQDAVAVAEGENGCHLVLWDAIAYGYDSPTCGVPINGRRYDVNGVGLDEFKLSDEPWPYFQFRPHAVRLWGDEFQVAWEECEISELWDWNWTWLSLVPCHLLSARIDINGTMLGPTVQVEGTTADEVWPHRHPIVLAWEEGHFLILWRGKCLDEPRGICAQRYHADGTENGTNFRLNILNGFQPDNHSAAVLDDGTFVVVWESCDNSWNGIPSQDGDGCGVYLQRFAQDGTKL